MTKKEVRKKTNDLVEIYNNDIPSKNGIDGEILCWYLKWKEHKKEHGKQSLPKTLSQSIRNATSMFANIKVLQQILCTLPVKTCSSERSHSALKRIKVAYHSTMTNKRLTFLSLLHVHRDTNCDVEAIIDEFSQRHPRRLRLYNILAD